jgi:Flp pilus assembly protein TadD
VSPGASDDARAQLHAGDYARARETATAGLSSTPEDPDLLRIAGLAGLELGADDAIDQLRRVTDLRPDQTWAWHELGDALATEGRNDEATQAFRQALDLNPDDEMAMTHLGHAAFQSGEGEEGVKLLEQVAGRISGNSTAAISLVEMYRTLGKPEEALASAIKVAEADPGDRLYAGCGRAQPGDRQARRGRRRLRAPAGDRRLRGGGGVRPARDRPGRAGAG